MVGVVVVDLFVFMLGFSQYLMVFRLLTLAQHVKLPHLVNLSKFSCLVDIRSFFCLLFYKPLAGQLVYY